MVLRRFHYDQAFEKYLRTRQIPYVAVDEAKRALAANGNGMPGTALKNFDFVVYSTKGRNLLVDVKGRKHNGRSHKAFDNWVTQADIDSLARWQHIFGDCFTAAFAFLYWCHKQPPDALFHEIFESAGRWYALLAMPLEDYAAAARPRSARWQTVAAPAATFAQKAQPLCHFL